jgi:hypothetical protein
MNRFLKAPIGVLFVLALSPVPVFAQLCPYEPLGELKGETAVCAIAAYNFQQGSTNQSTVDSSSGTSFTTYDGLGLFGGQLPQPSNILPPFRSSSEIVVLGTSESASGIRIEQRGRLALAPRADDTAFSQTGAFESHARVTFTPFKPGDSSNSNVNVTVNFVHQFRLTDDAAGGGDSGQANVGATVMLRNANELHLMDDIAGSASLNVDNGENPNLWNAFEAGGSSAACGDGCQDVSVQLQREAMVPANQPVSVDAYTFGLADNYASDQAGTVYSADNLNTAIISISSADPDVRFAVAGDLPTVDINAGMNDAWYDPTTNGQGLLMTVFSESKQMFVAWFTYDVERPAQDVTAILGDPGHRWLTAQGPYEGNTANLTIFVTKGGTFDSAEPAASTDPAGDGTMTVTFKDCETGIATYEIASLGISGEVPIQRIVNDNAALCETLNGL